MREDRFAARDATESSRDITPFERVGITSFRFSDFGSVPFFGGLLSSTTRGRDTRALGAAFSPALPGALPDWCTAVGSCPPVVVWATFTGPGSWASDAPTPAV